MSDRIEVTLDKAGVAAFLMEDCRGLVDDAAAEIAENVDTRGLEAVTGQRLDTLVTVQPYTTDRAAALITIAHPGGQALQAKHGALTAAAAAAGIVVTRKKRQSS